MSINKIHYSDWHVMLDLRNNRRVVIAQVIDGPVIESLPHNVKDKPTTFRLSADLLSCRIAHWASQGWIEFCEEPPLTYHVKHLEPDPKLPSDYSALIGWRIRPDRQSPGALTDQEFVEYFRSMAEKFDAGHCQHYGVLYERYTKAFNADFGINLTRLGWNPGFFGSVSSEQYGEGLLSKYDTELFMLLASINRLDSVNPQKPVVRFFDFSNIAGQPYRSDFNSDNLIEMPRCWTKDFEELVANMGMRVSEVRYHAENFGFKLDQPDLRSIKSCSPDLFF